MERSEWIGHISNAERNRRYDAAIVATAPVEEAVVDVMDLLEDVVERELAAIESAPATGRPFGTIAL